MYCPSFDIVVSANAALHVSVITLKVSSVIDFKLNIIFLPSRGGL